MTRVVGGVVILEPEEPRECELCGAQAETRPYGPGGKRICHPCGMKDPEGTTRRMFAVLFGEEEPSGPVKTQ